MNMKNLSDQMLMENTQVLVKEEREILTHLLHHFREIERRRLYADYQYKSLHKMLVGHYGYSDDEAYRRTSAMRLLGDLPEVEEKINQGELNLSHLGLAQTFFRKEAKAQKAEISKDFKLEILSQISEQPLREAQRIVLSQSSAPEELRPDKVTVISDSKMEYRFTADKSLESKMEQVRGMLAHKHPSLSMGELVEVLCDLGIETLKKEKTATSRKSCINKVEAQSADANAKGHSDAKKNTAANSQVKSLAQIKRDIWQASLHKCQNCQSTFALEIDHIHPKAKGGCDNKENLRILCRSCNQRAAIRQFGQHKMDQYLN